MILDARERAQLRLLQLLAARLARGQLHGERAMRRRGPGSGFREHRAYHEGDPLRAVDWHVYARMDALVVKEFDAEEALDVVCVQDTSGSMAGAAARTAAKVVAGLGAIALERLDRVSWMPAGDGRAGETFTGRGRIAEFLGAIDDRTGGTTDLLASLRAQLPATARGGVAFVVSDFFDPKGATRALSLLLARRYRVRAIAIEDPGALAPPPEGRAHLIDAETRRALKVDVTPELIERYLRVREARMSGLRAFCHRRGAGFLRVRADQPFFEVVRAAIARGWLAR